MNKLWHKILQIKNMIDKLTHLFLNVFNTNNRQIYEINFRYTQEHFKGYVPRINYPLANVFFLDKGGILCLYFS